MAEEQWNESHQSQEQQQVQQSNPWDQNFQKEQNQPQESGFGNTQQGEPLEANPWGGPQSEQSQVQQSPWSSEAQNLEQQQPNENTQWDSNQSQFRGQNQGSGRRGQYNSQKQYSNGNQRQWGEKGDQSQNTRQRRRGRDRRGQRRGGNQQVNWGWNRQNQNPQQQYQRQDRGQQNEFNSQSQNKQTSWGEQQQESPWGNQNSKVEGQWPSEKQESQNFDLNQKNFQEQDNQFHQQNRGYSNRNYENNNYQNRGRGRGYQRRSQNNFQGRIFNNQIRSQAGEHSLIHQSKKAVSIWNPKDQTWVEKTYQNLDQDIFIQPFDQDKNSFISVKEWNEIDLPEQFYENILLNFKYQHPSKIQQYALPLILEDPYENLIAQAHNGSGKTIAFALGSLARVDHELDAVQVICLAHTRELAQQIWEVYRNLAEKTGITISIMLTEKEMKKQSHVLVTSPSVLLRQLRRNQIKTEEVRVLIFDEADYLFDDKVENNQLQIAVEIKEKLPLDTQILCFSATYSDSIRLKVESIVAEANKIQINNEELTVQNVKQMFIEIDQNKKNEVLQQIYKECEVGQAIIFTNSKQSCVSVTEFLRQNGHKVAILMEEEMSLQERDATMSDFRRGKSRVLVTTNLISRGIDVITVTLVINYEIPLDNSSQTPECDYETYLHRIGRTGRFGRRGVGLTLVSSQQEKNFLQQVSEYYACEINEVTNLQQIQEFLLQKPQNPELEGQEESKEEIANYWAQT